VALLQINAIPNSAGNRIDLSWVLPSDQAYTGVRVVRRAGSYPVSPDDGVIIAQANGLSSVSDSNLQNRQVYYYTLFPYRGDPPLFEVDGQNRVSAMATAPEAYADYMYDLLPAIYHRYDRNTQSLKRFLQLTGQQLDQWHSYAQAIGDLQNPARVDGKLLPLLAQWIGWNTDYKLELDAQRGELRDAPSIYSHVGLIPVVEATIKRNIGWDSQTKEFVHNIMTSNQPAQLNFWSLFRDSGDNWSKNAELVSLDYAFEGRAASCIDSNGIRWVYYHTRRKGGWEIWYKSTPMYSLPTAWQEHLRDGVLPAELHSGLIELDINISSTAVISTVTADQVWQLNDGAEHYSIERHFTELQLYHTTAALNQLAPSRPLISRGELLYKYPSAAQQLDIQWLFWSAYNKQQKHWKIQYRRRSDAIWTEILPAYINPELDNPFASGGVYDPLPQRYRPCVCVDGSDRLWMFWLEHDGSAWRLRYNRRDPGGWGTPVDFPSTGDPRVSEDFNVLISPDLPGQGIYVFWPRPANTLTPGQQRREIAYRFKSDLNLDDLNWGAINNLPKASSDDNHHDCDPHAVLRNNRVELFWSSNRGDTGWSVWRSELIDPVANTWDAAETESLTDAIYDQRYPLALVAGVETFLLFRSNQGRHYVSDVYGVTRTTDERYNGSSTVDVRHTQKFALWKTVNDIQRYSYDAGRNDDDWIARDTIGIYLDNDTQDAQLIQAGIERLKPILAEFMPLTDRAVFISENRLHTEYAYSYGQPISPASYYISASYEDELNGVLINTLFAEGEEFTDGLGG
jgi:phage tail-like protein